MSMRQRLFSIFALMTGLLLMIGTTAYAEEGSVTLNSGTTSSGPISSDRLFVIGETNLYVSAQGATISASSNIKIKKLVITRGAFFQSAFSADGLSVSPGTMSFSGTVLTVTDINSSTVQLSRLAGINVSFSSIVVYYDYTAVTGVTLSQTEASMIVGGETLTLTPTFTPSEASIKTVTWTTSDASVATVANGVVTAVGAGTATITAIATNGTDDTSDDKTATCTVTVSYVNVSGVTLSQTAAAMTVGDAALTLSATVAPSNASNKTVTWTTSDESVATVADGVVTAVGAGTATITATATNGTSDDTSDDQTATCAVTVSNPTVTANDGGDGNYWSTYYNATLSFTADANTTVYKAALNGTSSVTLTEVAGREIPAGQAVILKSTTGTITLTPAATTSSDFTGNDLKGGTTVTSGVAYTLSRGSDSNGVLGFYQYDGATLDGSKAHLEIPSSSPARSFIGIGDGTTAIELPALAEDEAAEWYSLDGRRLSGRPAQKGIYVKNGQKVVIK